MLQISDFCVHDCRLNLLIRLSQFDDLLVGFLDCNVKRTLYYDFQSHQFPQKIASISSTGSNVTGWEFKFGQRKD